MIIQLMGEDKAGNAPDLTDLENWANKYDVTYPILADPNWSVGNRYEEDGYIPTWSFMAPGMEILWVDQIVNTNRIIAELPEAE